jgi:hypothetical protein
VFGRLKIALVALVLMPAAAFAADHEPMHSPGHAAVVGDAGTKKIIIPAGAGESGHKHHSSAKSVLAGPSPIELFLRHLRGADHAPAVVASTAGKQAAVAISGPALPSRTDEHQPG